MSTEHRLPQPRLLCLGLALVTIVLYSPAFHHGFVVYDDPDYVTDNPTVQAGLTWPGVKWAFNTFHASNWHPLTWLSHMIDCQCFGLDPGAHHLMSVLFHAINSALLLLLVFRLTRALWASAFVAALFACHPLHVESAAWVAERKDVLSTMFWLLSLLAYVRYVGWEAKGQSPAATSPQSTGFAKKARRAYLWALGWFGFGLMSKPMLVTLPCTLLLLDYWPLGRVTRSGPACRQAWWRLAVEKWPFFVFTIASCVVTFQAQRSEAVVGLEPDPLVWRLGNAIVSYVRYLAKAVWPVKLAVIYPLPHGWPWVTVTSALALLISFSWLAWRTRKSRPHLLIGWLWFLGTLVPVIGLVQVGGQAMADRYTYVPLMGIFIALGFEARNWLERWNLSRLGLAVLSLCVLACLAGLAEMQLGYWTDSQSLFSHTIAVTHDNAIAHLDLGVALEEAGKRDEALNQYQQALQLRPGMVQVHNNLGNLYDQLGRTQDALAQYQEALRLKPDAALVHANLGSVLLKMGRFSEAMDQLNQAARLAPDDPRYEYLIGKALLRQGRSAEAVHHFEAALREDPNHFNTLVYLARVLAADLDQNIRNGPKAVELAERASAQAGEQPFILDTLAMAYAENGRFARACQKQKEAIERIQGAGEADAVAEMQIRLHLYQTDHPYRAAWTNALPEQISN